MEQYKVYIVTLAMNGSSNWTFLYGIEAESDELAWAQFTEDKKRHPDRFCSGKVNWVRACRLMDSKCRRRIKFKE